MVKWNCCLACIIILCLLGCNKSKPRPETIPSMSQFAMSTICTITLYEWGELQIYQEVFERLKKIEEMMSLYIEGSELNLINQAAGLHGVQVSRDLFYVIERALYFAGLSGGAFDPTVGPLVALWGIGGEDQRVPSQEEIYEVLPLVNWRNVELDHPNQTVFLKKQGMALDLGAIAKGYAADEAAAIIRRAAVPQAIVNLGGNAIVIGGRADGSLWRVGIQNPLEDQGSFLGVLETREKTIVTSGLYQRYFEVDGIHYHHIFSTVTGYPAKSGLLAVTIIADISMDADALSTVAFVLGYKEGRALIESLDGVQAIFVLDDRTVHLIGDLDFTITDDYFTLIGE